MKGHVSDQLGVIEHNVLSLLRAIVSQGTTTRFADRQRGKDVNCPTAQATDALTRHTNILKRLLIHVGGFNLGLLMREAFGVGKPRRLQGAFRPL